MKKALLSIAAMALLSSQGFAQITITNTSFGSKVNTTDRLHHISNNSFNAVIGDTGHINLPRTNHTWDITGTFYQLPTDTSVAGSIFYPHVPYTGYDYADSMVEQLSTMVTYTAKHLTNITATGIVEKGQHISRKAYSLSSLPGAVPTDSLIILDQDDIYYDPIFATPAADTALKLPLTMGTTWNNNYMSSIKAEFTYAIAGYIADTLERRRLIINDFVVIGWGNMRLRKPGNAFTDYFNVLQTRANFIQVTDSFYINGVPATSTELGFFGLAQGVTSLIYNDYYYRSGEVVPLVKINFTDASRNVLSAGANRPTIHSQRLSPSGINNVGGVNDNYSVYPNPVNGSELTIDLNGAQSGNWTYELINVTGQSVAVDQLHVNGGKATVNLPQSMTPGIYYIMVNNNGVRQMVKSLDITK